MQPIPKVTHADVLRIVRRDYQQYDHAEIMNILDQYQGQGTGTARVQLAALKLAGGDIEQLRILIEAANLDYRDVLAYAEYPGYMKYIHLPGSEEKEIIEADWAQYQAWLNATEPQRRSKK